MKFRKKPVVVEAFQIPERGDQSVEPFLAWALAVGFEEWEPSPKSNDALVVLTLEGRMTAEPGDWIIKGVKGEFYPCKPDIFATTYEEVTE